MVLPKTHLSQRVELLLLVALRRRGLSLRRVMPRGCQMRVRGRRDARQHVQYAAERTRRVVPACTWPPRRGVCCLLDGRIAHERTAPPPPSPSPLQSTSPFGALPTNARAVGGRRGRLPKSIPHKKYLFVPSNCQPLSLPHPRNLFLQLVLARTLSTALAPLPHPLPAEMAAPAPPLATPRAWSALPAGGQGAPAALSCFLLFSTAFLPFPLPASLPSAAQRPPSHLAFAPRSRLGARRVPVVGAIAREGHRKLLAILDLLGRPASGVTAYNLGGGRATCAL